MSRWFRMYNELLDDPKVQRLEPALFKTWVNILCLASRQGGKLPEASDIAFALRLSNQEASEAVRLLVGCSLLDETGSGLIPHNWALRQYKSDVSTERVKRFRNGAETSKKQKLKRSDSVSVSDSESESDKNKVESDFARFYEAYPRKQGRGQALKAFKAALAKTDIKTILAGVERYKKIKPNYADWAMPATWLYGERWLDEATPSGRVERPAAPQYGPKPTAFVDRDAIWKPRLNMWAGGQGIWLPSWGPKPGEPNCEVPRHLLPPHDGLLDIPTLSKSPSCE